MEKYWEADFDRESVAARLADRKARYRTEIRAFWVGEFLPVAAVILVVGVAAGWLFHHFSGAHGIGFWMRVLVVAALAMIPPVTLMHPKPPDEDSVAYDMLLNKIGEAARRSHHA